ncbi:MAG: hypothetical protein AAFZ15_13260 [Bacteroidota bacterium]
MGKSDALFQLVRSLNGTEKRYFKTFYSKQQYNQDRKFLLLFDRMVEMCSQESYDEALLLKNLRGAIDEEHLPYEKNYLYQAVLKSLRNYHAAKTPALKLKELMIDISLLYEKGLVADSFKHIRRAKKLALKYDFRLPLLELILMERRLIRQFMRKNVQVKLKAVQADAAKYLQEINLQFKSLTVYENIFSMILHSERTKDKITEYQNQLAALLPDSDGLEFPSFELPIYAHLSYSMLFLLTGEHEKRLHHLKKLISLFEDHPHLLKENQYNKRYINCLNNYINGCCAIGELEELQRQIGKMKHFQSQNRDLSFQSDQLLLYSQMLYFLKKEQFEHIVEMANEIEAFMQQHEKQMNLPFRVTFNLNLAVAYLFEKKFSEAHEKINQIINEPKFEVRRDIQMLSRIFRILLLIEEQEFMTAEYQVYAAIRYCKKFRKNNAVEGKILNILKQAVQNGDITLTAPLTGLLENKNGYEEVYLWTKRTNLNKPR